MIDSTNFALHPRNYDYTTCNKTDCHTDWLGGWVYNNLEAEEAVQGATVTITNSDNTIVEAVTRSDSFFLLWGGYANERMFAPYIACVSKCNDTVCSSPETHPTADDCRDCHDEANRIHVP